MSLIRAMFEWNFSGVMIPLSFRNGDSKHKEESHLKRLTIINMPVLIHSLMGSPASSLH